jgi:hypothetical protein
MTTVDFTCICGKQIRFKAEHAGKRTRCPDCSATITVPGPEAEEAENYDGDDERDLSFPRRSSSVTRVTGKRAVVSFGQVVPSMFGQTTLELDDGRLIETTHGPLSRRHAELLLTEVDSAEIRVQPNPALLAAAIATLFIAIGFVILIAYFVIRYKYLIIHSGNNSMVVAIAKNEDAFHDFMDAVLAAAAQAKQRRLS